MSFFSRIKDERIRILIAFVPAYLLTLLLLHVLDVLSLYDIRIVLLVLIPSMVITAILGLPLYRNNRIGKGGGWLYLFFVYCVFFALLSNTSFLAGSRKAVTATDIKPPPTLFGLDLIEDWHFPVAPKSSVKDSILIIGMESIESITEAPHGLQAGALFVLRSQFIGLLRKAVSDTARAIVFDYELEGSSGQDNNLAYYIKETRKLNIPVCICQGLHPAKSDSTVLEFTKMPDVIFESLDKRHLGHCMYFLQSDGKLRLIPTKVKVGLENDTSIVSLAQSIAIALEKNSQAVFKQEFLFVKGIQTPVDTINFTKISALPSFKNKLIFVGSNRTKDMRDTPFGRHWGVSVHALAAASLLSENTVHYVNRPVSFLIIFFSCFCMMLLQGSKNMKSPRLLLYGASILSFGIILLTFLAIKFTNVWIDAAFPLLALWLFTFLLWRGAKVQSFWNIKKASPNLDIDPLDTFIFHHINDTNDVHNTLINELEMRGLSNESFSWDPISPRDGIERIKDTVASSNSIIFAIGEEKMDINFEDFVKQLITTKVDKGKPVIGVIVAGDARQIKFPKFVGTQKRDLSLTSKDKIAAIRNIQWDITRYQPQPLVVFISYAHEDIKFKKRLVISLKSMQREELIKTWSDLNIIPSQRWKSEILRKLRESQLIVFLITPDFINSDFIAEVERPEAWRLYLNNNVHLIPIICRYTDWHHTKLHSIEALPTELQPIDSWEVKDKAWLNINKGIRETIKLANTQRRSLQVAKS